MLKSKYLFLSLICLLTSFRLHAQFMDYGSDPAKFKWNMARLPHYNLVYPQGNDSMAYRYALFLENVYPHMSKTIGKPDRKSTRLNSSHSGESRMPSSA